MRLFPQLIPGYPLTRSCWACFLHSMLSALDDNLMLIGSLLVSESFLADTGKYCMKSIDAECQLIFQRHDGNHRFHQKLVMNLKCTRWHAAIIAGFVIVSMIVLWFLSILEWTTNLQIEYSLCLAMYNIHQGQSRTLRTQFQIGLSLNVAGVRRHLLLLNTLIFTHSTIQHWQGIHPLQSPTPQLPSCST